MASFRNTQSPQSVYDYWTPQRMQNASGMGMGVNMGAGRGGAGGSLYQGYASPTGAGGGGLPNQTYQTAAGPVTTQMGIDRTGGGRTGATAQPYQGAPFMDAPVNIPGAGADTGQITGAPMVIGGSQPTAQQQQTAPWQQSNFGNMGYQDRLNAVNQYRQGQNQGTLQQQVQQMRNQYQPMGGFGFGGGQYGQMGGGGLLGGGQWGSTNANPYGFAGGSSLAGTGNAMAGMTNQYQPGAQVRGTDFNSRYNQLGQSGGNLGGFGQGGQWGSYNQAPQAQWGSTNQTPQWNQLGQYNQAPQAQWGSYNQAPQAQRSQLGQYNQLPQAQWGNTAGQ